MIIALIIVAATLAWFVGYGLTCEWQFKVTDWDEQDETGWMVLNFFIWPIVFLFLISYAIIRKVDHG